jgi:hypothetical protein
MKEASDEEDNMQVNMDDMIDEQFSDSDQLFKKPQRKDEAKSKKKTTRDKAAEADVGNEEEETVFIDNLPNTETEIRAMLKDVKKHIKFLEKAFFEEEDSEKEE